MAAYKRPSEADSAKWVVGDYFATDWQPADSERSPLPVSLDLAGLYEQLLRRLMPLTEAPSEVTMLFTGTQTANATFFLLRPSFAFGQM